MLEILLNFLEAPEENDCSADVWNRNSGKDDGSTCNPEIVCHGRSHCGKRQDQDFLCNNSFTVCWCHPRTRWRSRPKKLQSPSILEKGISCIQILEKCKICIQTKSRPKERQDCGFNIKEQTTWYGKDEGYASVDQGHSWTPIRLAYWTLCKFFLQDHLWSILKMRRLE